MYVEIVVSKLIMKNRCTYYRKKYNETCHKSLITLRKFDRVNLYNNINYDVMYIFYLTKFNQSQIFIPQILMN